MTIVPAQGQAVTTGFVVSAQGWYDEDPASLQFQFYRFPVLTGSLTVANGSADCCELPLAVEWDDASSPKYFKALGGLILQSWSRDMRTPEVPFPSGSFMVAVRVRDMFGAHGISSVTGPVVTAASNLQGQHLIEAINGSLSVSAAAADPLIILNTVDVLVSAVQSAPGTIMTWALPEKAALKDAVVSAIETAAGEIDGDVESVERLGEVVSGLVADLGQATGMVSSDLARLAASMEKGIEMGTVGTASGLTSTAAQAIVSGAVAIMSLSSEESGSGGAAEGSARSAGLSSALESLTQRLGSAMIPGGEGQVSEVNLIGPAGSGLSLSVARYPLSNADGGAVAVGGDVVVPSSVFQTSSRRLTASCDMVTLQRTEYISHNLYSWATSQLHVPQNASLKRVDLRQCGDSLSWLKDPITILFTLTRPQEDAVRPVCVRFDDFAQTWSAATLHIGDSRPVVAAGGVDSHSVICHSSFAAGIYAVAYEDVAGAASEEGSLVLSGFLVPATIAAAVLLLIGCGCMLSYHCRNRRGRRGEDTVVKDAESGTISPISPTSWSTQYKSPDNIDQTTKQSMPEVGHSSTHVDVDVAKSNDLLLEACDDKSRGSAPTAQSEDTQVKPCCQQGHEAEPYVTDDDLVMCDRCLRRGRRGDKLFACRTCNFDLCIQCAFTDALPRSPNREIKLLPHSEKNRFAPLQQEGLGEPYFNFNMCGRILRDVEDEETATPSRMEGNAERDYDDSLWKHIAGLSNSPLQSGAASPEENCDKTSGEEHSTSDVDVDLDAMPRLKEFYAI